MLTPLPNSAQKMNIVIASVICVVSIAITNVNAQTACELWCAQGNCTANSGGVCYASGEQTACANLCNTVCADYKSEFGNGVSMCENLQSQGIFCCVSQANPTQWATWDSLECCGSKIQEGK